MYMYMYMYIVTARNQYTLVVRVCRENILTYVLVYVYHKQYLRQIYVCYIHVHIVDSIWKGKFWGKFSCIALRLPTHVGSFPACVLHNSILYDTCRKFPACVLHTSILYDTCRKFSCMCRRIIYFFQHIL